MEDKKENGQFSILFNSISLLNIKYFYSTIIVYKDTGKIISD